MHHAYGAAMAPDGTPGRIGAYIAVEEGYYETVDLWAGRGHLCAGLGCGHPHCRHFSGGMSDVYCGFFVDRLRAVLPAAVKGGKENAHHRLESAGFFAGHSALLILRKGIEETALS